MRCLHCCKRYIIITPLLFSLLKHHVKTSIISLSGSTELTALQLNVDFHTALLSPGRLRSGAGSLPAISAITPSSEIRLNPFFNKCYSDVKLVPFSNPLKGSCLFFSFLFRVLRYCGRCLRCRGLSPGSESFRQCLRDCTERQIQ